MTFGFKVAGWHEEIRRSREILAERGGESFLTCFGGAIGTFAAVGGRRRAVEDEGCPVPWPQQFARAAP